MDLLREWADWKASEPPFVLESDQGVLGQARNDRVVTIRSWRDAFRAADFCEPQDHRLHLGLLPKPFLGDLRRASIYVLLLNPGVGPHDYYGEYEVAKFRRALLANLRQEFELGSPPFLFLDPQYSWHGGFGWWNGKLAGVIAALAYTWAVPFAEARTRLARELASIELVAYNSPSFRDGGRWIQRLQSVALAQTFVHDTVLPKVRSGKAIVIAARRAEAWNLPNHRAIIRYSPQEARAAHLSPKSRGGSEILRHLGRRV